MDGPTLTMPAPRLSAAPADLDRRYIACCGNDCAQCPHYQRGGPEGGPGCPEGCLGETCVNDCNACQVRSCNRQRRLANCAGCDEYPCQTLETQYAQMKTDGYEAWASAARSVLEVVRDLQKGDWK